MMCGAIHPFFWKLNFILFSAVSQVTWLVVVVVAVVVAVVVVAVVVAVVVVAVVVFSNFRT